jgi:NAD(P)-dependent dehydrogenase (short-subunit alcohol dehydrogenase family)
VCVWVLHSTPSPTKPKTQCTMYTQAEGGKLHVLVNNSGTNWAEALETFPLQAFDKVMALNVKVKEGKWG